MKGREWVDGKKRGWGELIKVGRGKINVGNETMSGRGRQHSAKRKTLSTNI
jgi:hypothetical protein